VELFVQGVCVGIIIGIALLACLIGKWDRDFDKRYSGEFFNNLKLKYLKRISKWF